ncbi:MAG: S8 family serine peptidase [Prolixibacteraceae bacterium]|nr:S8 family serine peptidase [Prolixibacteraceae bacterium]
MVKLYKYYFTTFILLFTFVLVMAQTNNADENGAYHKMHYELVIAVKKYNELSNNKLKSTSAKDKFKKELNILSNSIVIDAKADEPTVDVLIKARKNAQIPNSLFVKHKTIKIGSYDYIIATIKVYEIESISNHNDVLYIEPSFVTEPLLDESTEDIHADKVWEGMAGIPDCITGKGVYVGVVDSKVNKDHITFEDKDGESRFVDVYPFDNVQFTGDHGTHVAGIAAGNGGLGSINRGVAYESKLMWYPANKSGNGFAGSNSLIMAIDTMKKVAENKPLVINHSQGIFYGPRDGSLEVEKLLSTMIDSLGVIVVNAAGNQSVRNLNDFWSRIGLDTAYYPMHFQGELTNKTTKSTDIHLKIIEYDPKGSNTNNFTIEIEIWYECDIDVEVSHNKLFNAEITSRIKPGYDTISKWDEDIDGITINKQIQIINSSADAYEQKYKSITNSNVTRIIFSSDNKIFGSGGYLIKLYPHTENDAGKFDAYICENQAIKGGFRNGDDYQTVVSPGLVPNVICVANHKKYRAGGDIADGSSLGPLRSDYGSQVSKPDIAAPGYKIKSSFIENNDKFDIKSGTSMAAPHVTGAIALLLQCFPELNAIQVKEILQNSAAPIPSGTLDTEDQKYWGAGKLDILGAFKSMAGFSYARPYAYDENKYINAFENNLNAGLPFAPVMFNWGNINYSFQKFTNGAIFSDNTNAEAYCLGEGIWEKWLEEDSFHSQLGLPVTSEFADSENNNYPTVHFENGKIYWKNDSAIVDYWYDIDFTASITNAKAPIDVAFSINNIEKENINSCSWNFGDGNSSTLINPLHTYEKPGQYDVQLIINSQEGIDTIQKQNYINMYNATPLSKIEYYYDVDPGYDKGHPIPIESSVDLSREFEINYKDLTEGYHKLYVRAKDVYGNWGTVASKYFYAIRTDEVPYFTKMEYFFDENPGFGNGNPIPIRKSPSESIENFSLDFNGLEEGYHTLYIRGKDNKGHWGLLSKNPFYRYIPSESERITEVECYVDNDPGVGEAIEENVSPTLDLIHNIFIGEEYLTKGNHTIGVRVKNGYSMWSETKVSEYTINAAPVADAGEDIIINERDTIQLDGSASFDPDGDKLSYLWTAPEGITLNNDTIENPEFYATEISTDTSYDFMLVVNDGVTNSEEARVAVTVKNVNRAPLADAGSDVVVDASSSVTLDGSNSFDPDGDELTYQWNSPAEIVLSSIYDANPTFTAPYVSANTEFSLGLVVNDGFLNSEESNVNVSVQKSVGIDNYEFTENSPFVVYPNPAGNHLFIKSKQSITGMHNVKLTTLNGLLVREWQLRVNDSSQQLSLSAVREGMYCLEITTSKKNYIFKLIVKR